MTTRLAKPYYGSNLGREASKCETALKRYLKTLEKESF